MNPIDAFVISVDEPQLEECLNRVHSQSIPFNSVIHVNNVVPEHEAHNQAMKQLTAEWAMGIGGDFHIVPEAHEASLSYIEQIEDINVIGIMFGLYDSFLKRNICCCSVIKTKIYKNFLYKDTIKNDTEAGKFLHKKGGISIRKWKNVIMGTHFSNPTDKQVFCRFYVRGVKAAMASSNKAYAKNSLELGKLWFKTNDRQYKIAIKALNLGYKNKDYSGSHNKNIDNELYEKWKYKDGFNSRNI